MQEHLSLKEIRRKNEQFLIQVYEDKESPRFYPIVPIRGEGVYFWDTEGKKYLDFIAGISTLSLGRKHPRFNEAVMQVLDSGEFHESSLFYIEPQTIYAEHLSKVLPMKDAKLFFCNSGAEAVCGALKCASKKSGSKVVVSEGDFHGRYGDALAVTAQPGKREPFMKNLGQDVEVIEFNNLEHIHKIDEDTYAVILEPTQAEWGIIPAKRAFIKGVRERCYEVGAIFVVDEVQTGFGRTGKLFGIEHYDVEPDIMCFGKAIANGISMGAFAVNKKADLLKKGEHASTFGGNYLQCTVADAVLTAMEEEKLVDNSAKMGELMITELSEGLDSYIQTGEIKEIRGTGLLIGVEADTADNMNKIIEYCYRDEPRVVFGPANPPTIRLAPPLIVNEEEISLAAKKLIEACQHVFAEA